MKDNVNDLFDDYMWCPIHPFSEDLNEGSLVDDAFTDTLFQNRIDDLCVSLRAGDLELRLMSSRVAAAGFKKCSRVHIDTSVYDFIHHDDSV